MSPRKSSTSSGRPIDRPRYLSIEVAGVEPLPVRALETELRRRLAAAGPGLSDVRVIRLEGRRALVRVSNRDALIARRAWNVPSTPAAGSLRLTTARTYGTLRKGKAWLKARRSHS